MPELPDVEVFRRYLSSTALHQQIDSVNVVESSILKGVSTSKLKKSLEGERFLSAERYGKNLFVETSGRYWLRLHFGMTGFLEYFKKHNDIRHVRVLISFKNGYKLAYVCQRLLGQVSFEKSVDDFVSANGLGPDAMQVKLKDFRNIVDGRSAIKSLLMDQKKIAGLGNIYADEVLFQSKVHPKAACSRLGDDKVKEIYKNISKVINYAIKKKADPSKFGKNYLLPRRSTSDKCPNCGGAIKKIKVSGRSSYYCPACQKK